MVRGLLPMVRGLLLPRQRTVAGRVLTIAPGVLDPVLFRTGAWFAQWLAHRARGRVLDLGTGSGVVGLLAQDAGATVVAIDLDPRAVACARRNGLADVRLGDLFAPVAGERFDVIAMNPPFFRGRPRGPGPVGSLRRALYGGPDLEVVRRYGAQAEAHLRARGVAYCLWSDLAPKAPLPGWSPVERAEVQGEGLVVWAIGVGRDPT